jgi:hypothetical protein
LKKTNLEKSENICPHLLKKKSQRCGAPLSLVKDQFGGTIGRKKKACDLVAFLLQPQMWTFPCLLHDEVCFMVKFCLYFIMKYLTNSSIYMVQGKGRKMGLGPQKLHLYGGNLKGLEKLHLRSMGGLKGL